MLYDKFVINGMTVPNRLVRSATWEGLATQEGFVTPELTDTMLELVRGGVGLVITSHMFVTEQGRAGERQLGIHSDDCIAGLRTMVEDIHAENGVVVAQLAHAGGQAAQDISGMPALGPSPFARRDGTLCDTMTEQDIEAFVRGFEQAASRAVAAGFDGVQIHGAHGYALSQFLSPALNKRQDAYGGSIENRMWLLIRVYEAIRTVVGEKYPVLLKINSEDFVEHGLTAEESLLVIEELADRGLDAVEVSGGFLSSSPKVSPVRVGRFDTPTKEVWYRSAVSNIRERCKLPLMVVGGVRSFSVAEGLLTDGLVDFVAMSRPLIREPALLQRWKAGELRRADCISCNKCYGVIINKLGFYCPFVHDGA